ncbi:hypothetical protein BB558_001590 [Smittium angustum]|nr:hypothetical protein BB558_001590 [Smittium angustum]
MLDPSLSTVKLGLYKKVRGYLQFYKAGLKEVWSEHKLANQIRMKQKRNEKINWNEHQIVWRDTRDFKKIVPFAFLLFTVSELIPFLAFYFPQSLPSLVITFKQKAMILKKRDDIRARIHKTIIASTENEHKEISSKNFLTGSSINQIYRNFPNVFQISSMDRKTLRFANRFFGLSSVGTKSLLSKRILNHIKLLENDDMLLASVNISSLPTSHIIHACDVRGIPTTNFTTTHLIKSLEQWVAFKTKNPSLDPGLVAWTRIFLLSKNPNF